MIRGSPPVSGEAAAPVSESGQLALFEGSGEALPPPAPRLRELTVVPEPPLHGVRQGLDLLQGHGALLAGDAHPAQHLGPVERLPPPVPLDHVEAQGIDALEGGEAPPADGALPAPADGVLQVTRLQDA